MNILQSAADLVEAVSTVLPPDAISTATDSFSVDGLRPSLVVRPTSQKEVASTLFVANDVGAGVIPWGAGSHMHLGNPPTRYNLALDLRSLDRIIEHEPADLTATVEAGTPLKALQHRLAEQGQWLPFRSAGSCSIIRS